MLTPSGELVVQIESERFLSVGSGTSDFLYCSPVDGLNYSADGIGFLGQRVSLPAVVRSAGINGRFLCLGIRSDCFYPATTTFRTIRLYIYHRKRSKCKNILRTQHSTSKSKKGRSKLSGWF